MVGGGGGGVWGCGRHFKVASIYRDSSHRARFGGLDAVYKSPKNTEGVTFFRKQVEECLSQQDVYTHFINPPVSITNGVQSMYLA